MSLPSADSSGPSLRLREPVTAQALSEVGSEGSQVLRCLLTHLDRKIEIGSIDVPLPFCLQYLLFQSSQPDVVGIL
jgi:hypothetical protein